MNTLLEIIELDMSVKKHPDHKYIVALLENDTSLIEEIYSNHSTLIKSMVVKNNGSVNEAKDLFQECLIKLYKMAYDGFILTCPLQNFLYLMCKRKWLNELRNKQRKSTDSFTDVLENILTVDYEADINLIFHQEDQSRIIDQKLNELGPSCQKIIRLSWTRTEKGNYMKWKEIASRLDLSYAYVRKKAAECKGKLIRLVKSDPKFKQLINEQ